MDLDLDGFVERCRTAVRSVNALSEVKEAIEALLEHADELAAERPAPLACAALSGASDELFEDETVSIMLVHAPPHVAQPPHDHGVSVVIGGYAGVELHRLFRRTDTGATPIEASGDAAIGRGDVLTLGTRAVHAIDAAGPEWSSAVHVYLGQLSTIERSLFHPETLAEEPLDLKVYDSYCITS